MTFCVTCSGLKLEPNANYSYSGLICHCSKPAGVYINDARTRELELYKKIDELTESLKNNRESYVVEQIDKAYNQGFKDGYATGINSLRSDMLNLHFAGEKKE